MRTYSAADWAPEELIQWADYLKDLCKTNVYDFKKKKKEKKHTGQNKIVTI